MKDFINGPDEPMEEPSRPVQSNGSIQIQRKNATNFVALNESEIGAILSTLSPRANQARRFCLIVARTQRPTGHCAFAGLIGNLSDVAQKYNPKFAHTGFELACERPERVIKNQLGEKTGQQLWGFKRIPITSSLLGGAQ